jgi:hypothetical protein
MFNPDSYYDIPCDHINQSEIDKLLDQQETIEAEIKLLENLPEWTDEQEDKWTDLENKYWDLEKQITSLHEIN